MTETLEARGLVKQTSVRSLGDGSYQYPKLNRRGELCVVDFYTQMAMEKRGFEVRTGIDSATETGDAPIATTKADMSVSCLAGIALIPTYLNVAVVSGAGTLFMMALRVIAGTGTSTEAAFIPLPLWTDSTIAAISTANMNDEGGITVTADGLTTTNTLCMNGAAAALGAYQKSSLYQPLLPAVADGAATVYMQIGSLSIGDEYHATLQYIEIPTTALV